jgi:hypothetical protein
MRERRTFVWAALAAMGLCFSAAPAGAAEARDDEEREVSPKDLPAAVLSAIEAAYPNHHTAIKRATEDRSTTRLIYDVEVYVATTAEEMDVELKIAADGTILEVEVESADDDEDEDEL